MLVDNGWKESRQEFLRRTGQRRANLPVHRSSATWSRETAALAPEEWLPHRRESRRCTGRDEQRSVEGEPYPLFISFHRLPDQPLSSKSLSTMPKRSGS